MNSRSLLILISGFLLANVFACRSYNKGYNDAQVRGNEEILRTNLSIIRVALKEYSLDKGRAPEKLSDLVEAGYVNQIPIDPMTNKRDWVVVLSECNPSAKCTRGVKNVHSSSNVRSTDAGPYSDW